MRKSGIIGVAVAALIAVPLTGVTAASASFAATDDGYGPTLAAAEQNAKITINGDYGPCKNYDFYAYGQLADGTWWADVSASCTAFH